LKILTWISLFTNREFLLIWVVRGGGVRTGLPLFNSKLFHKLGIRYYHVAGRSVLTKSSHVMIEESRVFRSIARNWALCFLLSFIVLFSLTGKGFLSVTNFQNIIHLSVIAILMASAETFVIINGGIDLSIGFIMGLSSVTAGKIIQIMSNSGNYSPVFSILIGISVALTISLLPGLLSGLLIAHFKVPPFIATLGMWGITNGIALKICKGFPVAMLPDSLTKIGNGYFFYIKPGDGISFFGLPEGVGNDQIREYFRLIPNSFIFLIVFLLILWHLLKNTKFGQHTYAIGGNQDAAIRSGINVKKHIVKIYVLSSFIAGIAGVFNIFQTGIGNFTPFGAMYELFAVAAVVIGGASLMGGKGRIIASVVGVFLIAVLENGLLISGVEPFYRFIAVGMLLILAVVIDELFPDLF